MSKETPDRPSNETANLSGDEFNGEKQGKDPYLVELEGAEHPQQLPEFRKWIAVVIICSAALCVTCCSSVAAFVETPIQKEFHSAHVVTILSISLYVWGLGFGPLLVGPLSEVYGRNIIYITSYIWFFLLNFPVAFAPNMAVHLVFRFITGLCGAAFLSVAGGSVGDLFTNATVATPMSLYTISPFLGPIMGPLISGFITQNVNWRWNYYVILIWAFVEAVALSTLVPETYVPVLLARKARRLRKSTKDDRYYAEHERKQTNIISAIVYSCYTPFKLVIFERMILLLNIWTSLLLGILYLAFQAFPVIFVKGHHFNTQSTGLTFLGIGIGMLLGFSSQPYWNRRFVRVIQKYDGKPPPETRLAQAKVGAILVPIGLFWLAFTTYPHVHWIVPVVASVPFGTGIFFAYTSTFAYLVTTYRPVAASAMASNSAMRSTFAAVFPLFAGAMYNRLGTVGATALLAGLTVILAPLPFIFAKIGGRLREGSRFAVS